MYMFHVIVRLSVLFFVLMFMFFVRRPTSGPGLLGNKASNQIKLFRFY